MHSPQSEPLRAGDILLLVGRSLLRAPNLMYQSAARLKVATFTHAAIAYSPYSIADSNLGVGIKIRPWSKAVSSYDLSRSILLRYSRLETSPQTNSNVLAAIHFYCAQPYSVVSFARRRQSFRDKEGLVCSQFVSAVFEKAGVKISARPARKTFPHDIAQYLTAKPDWTHSQLRAKHSELTHPSELASRLQTMESLDQFFARIVEDQIALKERSTQLDSLVHAMCRAANRGALDASVVRQLADALDPDDQWSPLEAWRTAYATPTTFPSQPRFLHDVENPPANPRDALFAYSASAGHFAESGFSELESGLMAGLEKFMTLCHQINGISDASTVAHFFAAASATVIAAIDGFVGDIDVIMPPHKAPLAEARIEEYGELVKRLRPGELADPVHATECLKGLWVFDIQHSSWPIVRHKLTELARLVRTTIQ